MAARLVARRALAAPSISSSESMRWKRFGLTPGGAERKAWSSARHLPAHTGTRDHERVGAIARAEVRERVRAVWFLEAREDDSVAVVAWSSGWRFLRSVFQLPREARDRGRPCRSMATPPIKVGEDAGEAGLEVPPRCLGQREGGKKGERREVAREIRHEYTKKRNECVRGAHWYARH